MSYSQGPQQGPPKNNGNGGNGPDRGNPFFNFNSDRGDGNGSGGNRSFWRSPWLWAILSILIIMGIFGFFNSQNGPQTIDTKDGLALLAGNQKSGEVKSAEITEKMQVVELKLNNDFTKEVDGFRGNRTTKNFGKDVQFYYVFDQGPQVVKAVEKAGLSEGYNSVVPQTSMMSLLISSVLPMLIILGVFWFLLSRMSSAAVGNMFGMGGKKS